MSSTSISSIRRPSAFLASSLAFVFVLRVMILRQMSSGPGFRELPAHAFRPCGMEEEDVESKQLDAQTTSAALKLEGRYPTHTNFTSAFDDATHLAFDLSIKPKKRCFRKGWRTGDGGLDDSDRDLLLKAYIDSNSLFEFGLGESTRIAVAVGMPIYSGVDSDAVYVSESRKESPTHFKFYFADVGKTGHWGFPVDVVPKQVMQYQLSALQSEKLPFDVYFVDGRFRVACVCAAFLHASKLGRTDVSVLMHDYRERPEYHVVQEFADIVEHSRNKNLVLLKRKKHVTDEQIFDYWVRFRNEIT